MFIFKFIKKIFCKKSVNPEIEYSKYIQSAIKEEELTKHFEENNDLISDKNSNEDNQSEINTNRNKAKKKQTRIPQDQFLCSKCSSVPEILNLHSSTGILSLHCHRHAEINLSVSDYLDILKESTFFYLNNKCKICKSKPQGMKTGMKYCLKCKEPICAKCIEQWDMEHLEYTIPIGEKNNVCYKHPNENAEMYCQDCEEIICEDDRSHRKHNAINTEILKNDVEKYRNVIIEKNQKLFSMIRFYRLVLSSGNKEAIKQLENSIEKENEIDEYDKDLVIYYLKKNKLNNENF